MKKKYLIIIFLVFIILLGIYYYSPINNGNLGQTGDSETETMIMNVPSDSRALLPIDRGGKVFKEYIVVEGDSIDSIAECYGLNIQSILINNDITENDSLQTGQIIKIPPLDGILVTVNESDTLESLADEYGANIQEIADFNWLDYPYLLEEGMQLFVPMDFE